MAIDLVANLYLFKTLSPDQVAWITRLATSQKHAAGATLFKQGDRASALYIIKFGSVVIEHQPKGGEQIQVATLGIGAHFGELSLLTGDVRTASATTAEMAELLMLSFDRLKKLLEDQPLIGARVYKAMAQHLSGRLSATANDLSFVHEKLRTRTG